MFRRCFCPPAEHELIRDLVKRRIDFDIIEHLAVIFKPVFALKAARIKVS